ncbi:MAG: malonyl-CoA decarboxylase family protein [Novosphingobium sp.]|nr:malonyl-CoA decarboxylase family protein [Novosphingobium sp.]
MDMARSTPNADLSETLRRKGALDRLMGSRLGKLFSRIGIAPRPASSEGLLDLADALLSTRGRASGPALASAFFDLYEASDMEARHGFLARIHDQHPSDAAAIDQAIARWNSDRDEAAAQALNDAAESPCQKLVRRLNLAPQGTQRLIAMRTDLLNAPEKTSGLRALDKELSDAFTAWFNAGFLELRRIGWNSPANLLERIIKYEAVHEIDGWDDLRRRVEPMDRRCYGFFHPQMEDDPLIFVEVALTQSLPSGIGQIIAEKRNVLDPQQANCAIFYSISNCQSGLRGIPFGNYLIKRVVGLLQAELPQLTTFATLSPVPGFAKWLAREQGDGAKVPKDKELKVLAAQYLTTARSKSGQVLDSVARFHLGNGARLEAIHTSGDMSDNGLRQSHGVMVNYVYDLAEIEANYFALSELGTVAASKDIQTLLETGDGKPEKSAKGGKKDKKATAAAAA